MDRRKKVICMGNQKQMMIQNTSGYNLFVKFLPPGFHEEKRASGLKVTKQHDTVHNFVQKETPATINYDFDKNDVQELMKYLPNDKNFEPFDVYCSIAYALHGCLKYDQTNLKIHELHEVFQSWSSFHIRNMITKMLKKYFTIVKIPNMSLI